MLCAHKNQEFRDGHLCGDKLVPTVGPWSLVEGHEACGGIARPRPFIFLRRKCTRNPTFFVYKREWLEL